MGPVSLVPDGHGKGTFPTTPRTPRVSPCLQQQQWGTYAILGGPA
jgi:hypothetical protein